MNKVEQFIKKHLDESEERLLVKYDRWLRMVFDHIPIGVSEEQIHQYHLPQPALLSLILYQHSIEMLDNGQLHGSTEAKVMREKLSIKLSELPGIEFNENLTDEQAKKVLRARSSTLAGEVESDLAVAIKKILILYRVTGNLFATKEMLKNLLDKNKNRASLITITETTYSYNRGRLISYRENNVDYVRFSAIMDARTSAICASRHGLVMAMNSPDLVANTPPLHGRCRSVLTPIYSRYEPYLINSKSIDWSHAKLIPNRWI